VVPNTIVLLLLVDATAFSALLREELKGLLDELLVCDLREVVRNRSGVPARPTDDESYAAIESFETFWPSSVNW
jgi:hypothetical protein